MADPRMKELAYQALFTSFSRPNLGFEGITEIEQYAGSPALPSPTQEFTRAIPSMTPFEPTMRQRLSSGAQTGLEFFGMRRPQARSVSQAIFGGPSSPIPANLGIADVVPFLGTALQTEEAAESLGRAGQLAREGEYGQAAMQAGAGVLGLVPGAVGTARVAAPLVRQARTTPPVGAIGPIDEARLLAEGGTEVLTSYRGRHSAPNRDFGAQLHQLDQIFPDDIYSPQAARLYGHFGSGDPMDRQTVRIAQSLRGKPDADVTIYRAVPKDPSIKEINAGDWVTINQNYAKEHGESVLRGEYKIIKKKVKAKDIWTNADSIHEYGYDPDVK